MKTLHCPSLFRFHVSLSGLVMVGCLGLATQVLAQDSTFLACSRHEDRGQRIACLEDALDAAVAAQAGATPGVAAVQEVPATPAVQAPSVPDTAGPAAVPATASGPADDRSLFDRIRNFGREEPAASLSTDDNGQDRLNDTITALEKRNSLWVVTLSSGQVWRQTYPRTLQLREGDAISIYRDGIGNGFRLEKPRLSGFIRIERVQ